MPGHVVIAAISSTLQPSAWHPASVKPTTETLHPNTLLGKHILHLRQHPTTIH